MSGLLFIPGLEQADLADEATVQAALASALWFPGSPTSICGIEEPGLLFALSASTALNPYPLALFGADPTPDGTLWRGTLASSVFSDTGGATPATLGGTVARVNDTSGNGINLSQASSSLRPKFGSRPVTGIRNLLTYTEDFSSAAWAKNVITPTATTGPGGASGAWTLTCVASAGSKFAGQVITRAAGQAYTATFTLRVNTHPFVQILDTGDAQAFCNIDLSTGLAGTKGTKTEVDIESLGDGWYRCSVTFSAATVVSLARIYIVLSSSATYGSTFTAVGTEAVDVYQPQLEIGASATDYQKVVSAQDVSEAGVESVSYLRFDLYDDALPSAAFPDGLTGQVFVAGDGGCYVSDVTLAPAATFSIGGTSHNWTGATPGILRAVTGNTGRVLDVAVREGDFTETELDRLVRKYRALGGKGLLVPTGELLTLASMTGGTGWAYASSIWTKTAGIASLLSQAVVPIAAGYYLFEIAATRSAGTLTPRFTGTTTVSGAAISATGTHTGVLVAASGNNAFELSADSAFDGTVTAVSLQRLLPEEDL